MNDLRRPPFDPRTAAVTAAALLITWLFGYGIGTAVMCV